jgi:hypothetical protein
MFEKRFRKKDTSHVPLEMGMGRLPKPQSIPDAVGRHLVVKLKQEPDWVWNLKAVLRPRAGERGGYDFRVFDSRQVGMARVSVKDYHSLDDHPELILYGGVFNKVSTEVVINEPPAA